MESPGGQRRLGKIWDGSVRPTCGIIKTKMVFPGNFPFMLWNNEVPSLYRTPQHSLCPVLSQTYYYYINSIVILTELHQGRSVDFQLTL